MPTQIYLSSPFPITPKQTRADIVDLITPPSNASNSASDNVIDIESSPDTTVLHRHHALNIDDKLWSRRVPQPVFHPTNRLVDQKPVKSDRPSSTPPAQPDPFNTSGPSMTLSHGPIRHGSVFKTLDEGMQALYREEERRGHKWRMAQSRHDRSGCRKKQTLRCNRYYHRKAKHLPHLDPSDYRQGKTIKTDCNAHVNFNRIPNSTQWHVTTFDIMHNHEREVPVGGVATRPPTKRQKDLVKTLASDSQFTRGHISTLLQKENPDRPLEPRQISNMINKVRAEGRAEVNALGGDVASIIAKLQEKIQNGEGWRYHLRLDEKSTVVGLWWQSPEQAELGQRYYDIVINDNTYNRNQYHYPLDIGIAIDSHGMSRNIWYAFHALEDVETHEWVFRCHLDSAGRPPEVLASDRHPSLIAASGNTMPLTNHLFCLHHLDGNVAINLRPALGHQWESFTRDFWTTYRAVSPDEFQRLWTDLITKYPASESYLNRELYPCREKWAWAWVSHVFSAGVRTNGRVECENRVNKAFGGPKKTLLQLFTSLNERTVGQRAKEMVAVRQVSSQFHT